MGGKSSQSTQQITIPPEVLARYNSVNARAEETAQRPFQQYGTDASAFVAPLTATQQAGIQGANAYAEAAQPYYGAATQQLMGAQGRAQPYYQMATNDVTQGQGIGTQYANAATNALTRAQNVGTGLAGQALGSYGAAYQGAQPYNQLATGYLFGGSQAVNPEELGGQQIGKYMSPYLGTVLQGTAALQNQMNQQAMSGQLGNAIRQGAFGGDRAGIAAANLAQQQQLANAKVFSDILNQGYGQALSTAQQQQQLGLGAAQQNRAALQQAAQQALGIGQQQYGQGVGLAQGQAGIGQQLFGQGATAAQQLANLGQQQFGQNLAASQQMQALGQGLYGMGSSTSQQLAALGQGAQGAGLQGAQAQLAAGQAQQQTEQAGKQALYNQFLQQQSYPFQVAQFLANIAMGTGALSGSTTTTNQAMGGFSDRRLKENIKPVGKTYDGQTIYSYNFKGSPKTEIGLMAQEVEKKHPEAVGLAGGYKTVRYDKATEDAAEMARPHKGLGGFLEKVGPGILLSEGLMSDDMPMTLGGLGLMGLDYLNDKDNKNASGKAYGGSSMGGGVMPEHVGEGFYDGGFVGFDPGLMQQIMSSYQQMYAPISPGQGGPGAGGLAAASFVPAGNLPVGQLQTAGDLPKMASPMENASEVAGMANTIGQLGDKAGAWNYGSDKSGAGSLKKQLGQSIAAGKFDTDAAISAQKGVAEGAKDTTDLLKDLDMPFARGGLAGYASGGMPYDEPTERNKLGIPNEAPKIESLKTPGSPDPIKDNTMSTIMDVAKMAAMFAKNGGRIGYADGGETESQFDALAGLNREVDPMAYINDILTMSPNARIEPEEMAAKSAFSMPRKSPEAPREGLAAAIPALEDKRGLIVAPKGTGTRSVRNNNPGNIEDGSFAQSIPGYAGSDGRFAVFETPQAGRVAQIALIQSYIKRGHDTPLEIANRWAPGKEKGNNPHSYAQTIARTLGIGVNDTVPHNAAPLIADAQTLVEGGPKALKHFGAEFARGGYADGGSGRGLLPANIQDDIDRENNMSDLDVPDRAPEPRPAGVAAAAAPPPAPTPSAEQPAPQKIRGLLGNIAHGKFISGLGEGKAESWIPLLSGLATFGTTPSRSALTGALAGLGAGAQAAQAQREFARQQQETGIRGFTAQTERQKVPITQQLANVQNLNALQNLRGSVINTIRQMEAVGTAVSTNPAYQRALSEYSEISKKISDLQQLGVSQPAVGGTPKFLGNVDLSDPYNAQKMALGLAISGLPGGDVPASVASAARDTGKVLTAGGVQEAPGYAGTTANITSTVKAAQEATDTNRETYQSTQQNWHDVKLNVIPVLEQLPKTLPETGLTGSALSNLASAVRVLASTQGYDASSINGSDPRSVITAAGQMLNIPVSADNPTASVNAIINAMKRRVVQISNAARASGQWAAKNTDPRTGRPDFSRGNVLDEITKAMAQ